MMRIVEFYDKDKLEQCGSDSIWIFDQRYSNATVISKVPELLRKQLRKYSYFRIARCASLLDKFTYLTDYISCKYEENNNIRK